LFNDSGLVFPASLNPQAVKTAVISIPGPALSWALNTPVFPAGLDSDLACGTVVKLPNGQLAMNTSQARSPMYTWTLGLEHAFGPSTSLTVNYVGTHT